MTFLYQQLFLCLYVPQTPSLVVRPGSNKSSLRMELNRICYVVMFSHHKILLEFEFRIQTPNSNCAIGRCSCQIWSFRINQATLGVPSYVYHSISVTQKLCAQLTIRNAPNTTSPTPATRREKLLIWRQCTSWDTPIVSILRFLDDIGSNLICEFFNFLINVVLIFSCSSSLLL